MPGAALLRKITDHKFGLRNHIITVGEAGAAYAMSDLGDRVNSLVPLERGRFIHAPQRGGAWEREWAQRYFNSVGNIKRLATDGRGKLAVYTGVGFALGAEQYRFPEGLGDPPLTFRKAQVPRDTQPIGYYDFTEKTTIQELMIWVTAHITIWEPPVAHAKASSSSAASLPG